MNSVVWRAVCLTRDLGLKVSLASVLAMTVWPLAQAHATKLEEALADVYMSSPRLNGQRASVRAVDESVPQALSGYRPRVSATGTLGASSTSGISSGSSADSLGTHRPATVGLSVSQTLFDGFQTSNRVGQAEAQVSGARALLRETEQAVLLDAVTAYMNVLRDSAILDLQNRNVEVLVQQHRQAKERFRLGEVTRTDVAQADARVAAGRSAVLTAKGNYETAVAVYQQSIGRPPSKLRPVSAVDHLAPGDMKGAILLATANSPAVMASELAAEVARYEVKVAKGALYPTVSVSGNVLKNRDSAASDINTTSFSVLGTLSVPIYQGGKEYSSIRSSHETVLQRELELDQARDQARSFAIQRWSALEAAKAQVVATNVQVTAAETALNGVSKEAAVGQRTTIDVLNAQRELVNARVDLVTAQRNRIVASYSLLASVGRLSAEVLGLKVQLYDPQQNYRQVRDAWVGVRASGS